MEYLPDKNPLISVIFPVNDHEQFLPASLQSILAQNYQNIEIIAVNDFSRDNSLKILRQYKKQDKRLKVFANVKRYGLAITLNRALRRTKGKFIVFMDPRDSITKNKLQKQLDFLLKNEKVVAVGTQCYYTNDNNKRLGKSDFPALHEHISQKPIHGISVLFEGIMINRYRIPKDLLYFPMHKRFFLYSDMTMKLMQYGEIANLREFLHHHRKHNDISSTTKHLTSLVKLWIKSKFDYEETPSFRSFFSTALKAGSW